MKKRHFYIALLIFLLGAVWGESVYRYENSQSAGGYSVRIASQRINLEERQLENTPVYIAPTGDRYHFISSCAGENAIEVSLEQVEDVYTPCMKCAKNGG